MVRTISRDYEENQLILPHDDTWCFLRLETVLPLRSESEEDFLLHSEKSLQH
jgi:hypothetical protein